MRYTSDEVMLLAVHPGGGLPPEIKARTRGQSGSWHGCGTGEITAKGQFERIKPLNRPFILCPRQDSNLRHPL
ncbi:hypothetical protein CW362_23710 [Streptomyces populi]|uniref:Uncharacterized protein n=1 Tax=Streptomyces populi TaxID=2058924 RepID=A0A2I0SKX9_9ACTN|nr:hypothetical protein CW362_23710 [Streptomyces populi]